MNITKQQYSKHSVVFDSHKLVGKLPGRYSSTVSVGWIHLYHVSAHSPTSIVFTADTSSSNRPWLFSQQFVNHAREHVNIPEYTEHLTAYTDLRNQIRQTQGKWYIVRFNYSVCGAVIMINVGLAQARPKYAPNESSKMIINKTQNR